MNETSLLGTIPVRAFPANFYDARTSRTSFFESLAHGSRTATSNEQRVDQVATRAFFIIVKAFVSHRAEETTRASRLNRPLVVYSNVVRLSTGERYSIRARERKDFQVRLIRLEIQSANGRGASRSVERGLGSPGKRK